MYVPNTKLSVRGSLIRICTDTREGEGREQRVRRRRQFKKSKTQDSIHALSCVRLRTGAALPPPRAAAPWPQSEPRQETGTSSVSRSSSTAKSAIVLASPPAKPNPTQSRARARARGSQSVGNGGSGRGARLAAHPHADLLGAVSSNRGFVLLDSFRGVVIAIVISLISLFCLSICRSSSSSSSDPIRNA